MPSLPIRRSVLPKNEQNKDIFRKTLKIIALNWEYLPNMSNHMEKNRIYAYLDV